MFVAQTLQRTGWNKSSFGRVAMLAGSTRAFGLIPTKDFQKIYHCSNQNGISR